MNLPDITEVKLAIIVIGIVAISAMVVGAVTGKIADIGVAVAISSGIAAIAGLAGFDMKKSTEPVAYNIKADTPK